MRHVIQTEAAPTAIGTYSQAVQFGNLVFLSGQIPLDPLTMQLVEGDFEVQARRMFDNLKAVAEAAGASLNAVVRLDLYLTDLSHFATLNSVMAEYFDEPYPARAAVGVASLPRGALVEASAILALAT